MHVDCVSLRPLLLLLTAVYARVIVGWRQSCVKGHAATDVESDLVGSPWRSAAPMPRNGSRAATCPPHQSAPRVFSQSDIRLFVLPVGVGVGDTPGAVVG